MALVGSGPRDDGAGDRPVCAALLSAAVMLMTSGVGVAAPLAPKNQASSGDTIIAPGDRETRGAAEDVRKALRAAGVSSLDRIALVDATVDPDGCMSAPLAANPEGPSAGLRALAEALQRRGVSVTLIDGRAVRTIDDAQQRRVQAMRGAIQLSFGEGGGRWLANKAELVACTRVDEDDGAAERKPHAALAALLAALGQDAVLAVGESRAESKGATWNVIEGELSSDGKSLDAGASSAEIAATLVLKGGHASRSAVANAQGALRPPLDREAVAKLSAYMVGELSKLKAFRETHPDADEPPADLLDGALDAIASGDLNAAPPGTTLGPSAQATLDAAADRLAERLKPAVPGRPHA